MSALLWGTLPLVLTLLTALTARASEPLTGTEKETALAEHNRWRRQEGSSDMMEMQWDEDYAASASFWAAACEWDHKIEKPDTLRYAQTGQNTWMGTGSLDIEGAIKAWYNEKQWYNYNTGVCQSGKVCGHYTQLVWAETYLVGCAKETCTPLLNSGGKTTKQEKAEYLVCNYGPGGNQAIDPYPFLKGPACSNCTNNKGYCRQDLCHNCVTGTCECKLACQNCGVPKNDTCSCDCPQGWGGQDCSRPCTNAHENCDNGKWPSHVCDNKPLINYIHRYCPANCGDCKKGAASGNQCAVATMNSQKEAPNSGGKAVAITSITATSWTIFMILLNTPRNV